MSQTSSPHIPQGGFDHPYFNNLDPSVAAKQMAFLNPASMSRITNGRSAVSSASQPPIGISSGPFLGGIVPGHSVANDTANGAMGVHSNFQIPSNHPLPPNLAMNSSIGDPSMSQPNQAPRTQAIQSLKQRQRNFLMGLANVMANRNTPLPPALTGIPYPPNYDPNTSPWKIIEASTTELGSFRLAGKDVDLFKLWGIVYQAGGGTLVRPTPPSCKSYG
jgi:SWI/SNF chromatin-remodeling complex subunit SWI1